MLKIVYILLGTLSLSLGVIGIVVPGLPTTPFLLLAAALYFKSSKRLYFWLLNTKYLGNYIRKYRENRAIDFKVKIYAIIIMWVMILCSVFIFIENIWVRAIVLSAGIIGTIVMSKIPTIRKKNL